MSFDLGSANGFVRWGRLLWQKGEKKKKTTGNQSGNHHWQDLAKYEMKILNNLSIFWLHIIKKPGIEIWRLLLVLSSLISGYWKTPKSLDFLIPLFGEISPTEKRLRTILLLKFHSVALSLSLSLSLSRGLLLPRVCLFLFFFSSSTALGGKGGRKTNHDNGKDPALFSNTFATLLLLLLCFSSSLQSFSVVSVFSAAVLILTFGLQGSFCRLF
jgi:hypothetical protein